MMHTLRVQQLSFAYEKKEVLKDIEFQIPFGKISVILGAIQQNLQALWL